MTVSNAPSDPREQLQWLVDRAVISDLLIEFARALDDADWDAYAATFDVDGELAISPTVAHVGRAGLAEFVAASLAGYPGGTHHLSTNHAIHLDGDRATTRSYLVAAHVYELDRQAIGAGWFDCRLRRSDGGWRFERVALTIRYVSGEPIAH